MLLTYRTRSVTFALGLIALGACAKSSPPVASAPTPSRDPRVGLRAGKDNAAEAQWNLKILANAKPPERFVGATNSDLSFTGNYAIQGNYNGPIIWDISNPSQPKVKAAFYCPASQNDVSVYKNLMFVSAEAMNGRVDCMGGGVQDTVSKDRFRGVRVFDISDIANPKLVANVQTCRGSHTHTVVEDPKDKENVYVYVSGSFIVRSPNELPGCVRETPDKDPNSSLFRIEVIKVPLANPAAAAIVASPRIFSGLTAPETHGLAPDDLAALNAARAQGAFIVKVFGNDQVLPPGMIRPMLDSIVKARGGTGAPTGADSAALRDGIQGLVDKMIGAQNTGTGPRPGPTQCHD
ncbi:MAG TPA: hypothetical protein VH762_01975, partial [Gemmatimonadaceae bacterium]